MITEWGPTGWWERPKTSWGAPVEQTSSQKCTVIERRYLQNILEPEACMGSFVFLWGQKEERTPTWFGLFVESGVEGLPLDGQPTPAVEVMERLWKQTDTPAVAPVGSIIDNGRRQTGRAESRVCARREVRGFRGRGIRTGHEVCVGDSPRGYAHGYGRCV